MPATTNLIIRLANCRGPIAAHIVVHNGLIGVNGSNELKYEWAHGTFSTPPARYVSLNKVRFPRCRLVRGLEHLATPASASLDTPNMSPRDVANRIRAAA